MSEMEMAEFLLKLRDRSEMPINENEYYLLGDIAERLNDACKFCQNNPNNGGIGICNCVLGSPVIY